MVRDQPARPAQPDRPGRQFRKGCGAGHRPRVARSRQCRTRHAGLHDSNR
jgi:hypothetical protein